MTNAGPETRCVLFAGVHGSFRLTHKLGVAEANRAIDRCLRRMERGAEGFKGRIVKTQKDQITVVFDSAEAACMAANEMQQRIADLPPVSGLALAIRIGFHHGLVIEQDGQLSGPTADIALRLFDLAEAGQTLTTTEAMLTLPKALRGQMRAIDNLTVPGTDGPIRVCEAAWGTADEPPATRTVVPKPAKVAKPVETRLRLRLADQELVLGPDRPTATLGRDANADIVTMDTRASRAHGRIEYRRDKYILTDQSTNGTYVTFAGEPEFALKREEAILSGRGRICFGHASGDAPTETLEFEVVGL